MSTLSQHGKDGADYNKTESQRARHLGAGLKANARVTSEPAFAVVKCD